MNSDSFVRFHLVTHNDAYWLPFIFNVVLPTKFPFTTKALVQSMLSESWQSQIFMYIGKLFRRRLKDRNCNTLSTSHYSLILKEFTWKLNLEKPLCCKFTPYLCFLSTHFPRYPRHSFQTVSLLIHICGQCCCSQLSVQNWATDPAWAVRPWTQLSLGLYGQPADRRAKVASCGILKKTINFKTFYAKQI